VRYTRNFLLSKALQPGGIEVLLYIGDRRGHRQQSRVREAGDCTALYHHSIIPFYSVSLSANPRRGWVKPIERQAFNAPEVWGQLGERYCQLGCKTSYTLIKPHIVAVLLKRWTKLPNPDVFACRCLVLLPKPCGFSF
jgi:hypothetical protein